MQGYFPPESLKRMSFAQLQQEAERCFRKVRTSQEATQIEEALLTFDRALRLYWASGSVCRFRVLEGLLEERLCYLDDLEELREHVEQVLPLQALLSTTYQALLEKEELGALAQRLGRLFFLRLQNQKLLFAPNLSVDLQLEQILMAKGPRESFWQTVTQDLQLDSVFLRQASGLEEKRQTFWQLRDCRQRLAVESGLNRVADLAFLRAERLEQSLEESLASLELVKRYVVPLATALRREYCVTAGADALTYVSKLETALDLRPWPALQEVQTLGKILERVLLEQPEANKLSRQLDQILKQPEQEAIEGSSWLAGLKERGLWRTGLKSVAPERTPWSTCEMEALSGEALVLTSETLTGATLPRFLRLLGEAYARHGRKGSKTMLLTQLASDDTQRLIGEAFTAIALHQLEACLEWSEAELAQYKQAYWTWVLSKLCWQAMCLDFEHLLYQEGVQHEQMETRWSVVLEQYFPDVKWEAAQAESNPLRSYLNCAQLWQSPFASVGRLWALLGGFQLWDFARTYPEQARRRYLALCALSSQESFEQSLREAAYPNLWSPDHLKRLAYQLAWECGR